MLNNEWRNLMKHDRNPTRRWARVLVALALAAGLGVLAGTAAPAMAETRNLDGTQPGGLSFYPHAYRETNAHNAELIIIDSTFQKWTYFLNKATGAPSNPPGTFFLRVEIDGGCGGNCAPVHWTGRISFNNPVTNGQAVGTE
jgi:hypothetical protein